MNKTRLRRYTVWVLVLGLLGVASPATAKATKIEISGTNQVTGILDPGDVWMSGPIRHTRDLRVQGSFTIDSDGVLPANGTSTASVNTILDTSTLKGRVWGTGTLELDGGGFENVFFGHLRPAGVPGGLLAEYVVIGHGYGQYEGMHLRASVREIIAFGSATFVGTLLTVGDR